MRGHRPRNVAPRDDARDEASHPRHDYGRMRGQDPVPCMVSPSPKVTLVTASEECISSTERMAMCTRCESHTRQMSARDTDRCKLLRVQPPRRDGRRAFGTVVVVSLVARERTNWGRREECTRVCHHAAFLFRAKPNRCMTSTFGIDAQLW